MARIYRDAWGVPHVRASSVSDLASGQGEVTARDRSWQLEFLRRRAAGTTAEVFGTAAFAWDLLARRTRIADTARRAHDALDSETQAFVAAYVEGVNAGLHADAPEFTELDIEPQPWEAWTPLAVFHAQHILFASLPGKLWAHRAREVLGADAALLSAEGPSSSGSNAWVVGGARTVSGLPLIGGDPHRTFESPGVYQQIRLACEAPGDTLDVVGFAFPGVPGIQHFAQAGQVAWAITNAAADYQDVYAERLRRVGDSVEALGPDGWESVTSEIESIAVRDGASERVEVVTTPRGVLFEGGSAEGSGLSLRNVSTVLGDLGFDAILPLLRARTVDDIDGALDHWVEPVNNVVMADSAGTVRYRVAGRIPVREEANRRGIVDAADPTTAWTGWLAALPRTEVAPDGQLVTANERRGPESEPIGTAFAAPHRARRLGELLEGRNDLRAADFAEFHNDSLLSAARTVQALIHDLDPVAAGVPVREAILAWDCRMEADSQGAAAYAAWRNAFVRRLAAESAFERLAGPSSHSAVFAPWLNVTSRIALALPGLVAAGTPYGIDLASLASRALEDAAGHPVTWGDTHVFTAAHAFDVASDELVPPAIARLPVSGDNDCVRCTGSLPGISDASYRGSVARYVWDLSDRGLSGWVVPLGASGRPDDQHHHDQLALWAAGQLITIVTDWDRLTEQTSYRRRR